jgi:hypothetical protein
MWPDLFQIGGSRNATFGVLMALAFLTGVGVLARERSRQVAFDRLQHRRFRDFLKAPEASLPLTFDG